MHCSITCDRVNFALTDSNLLMKQQNYHSENKVAPLYYRYFLVITTSKGLLREALGVKDLTVFGLPIKEDCRARSIEKCKKRRKENFLVSVVEELETPNVW